MVQLIFYTAQLNFRGQIVEVFYLWRYYFDIDSRTDFI